MRFAAFLTLVTFANLSFAQQPVAPTDAKSPEDERKSFKLPDGFVAQLVAAEPQFAPWPFGGTPKTPGIQKPIQLAFDAKGRLWVTTSYHYPFAAPKGEESDKLFVLSDFGDDGLAKKIEVFDDKLNIPIGILPLPDCKSCIVSSAGEILKLTDTDGDGKADTREVLFTGFGFKDTHGMYNSFAYLPDGWVYACHGFSNESRVKGKDGHEVHMQSGNTFRFRPDGSRIEIYTRGQVNPFGMTVDPWFNLYTADCHSKPITQLIKGAYYDSFGKPHDGLGYAPHVTHHDHGSTGLCGLTWYDADQFPDQWKGCTFLGNVVTNRINADKIEWKGSTPVAKELPDFLSSGDPWFRPSDIKLGPDGALYVSDFYNKIIGHYEVDLKHPGRDKSRGRVWRIVWQGKDGKASPPKMPFADLTKETPEKLVELTGSKNITTRLMATRALIERGKETLPVVKEAFKKPRDMTDRQFIDLVWVVTRLEFDKQAAFLDNAHEAAISTDYIFLLNRATQTRPIDPHAAVAFDKFPRNVRKKYENPTPGQSINPLPERIKEQARAERIRVDAQLEAPFRYTHDIADLTSIIVRALPEDVGLRHAARISLRNVLADPDTQGDLVWALKLFIAKKGQDVAVLDDVFLGVPTAYAGWWLSERLKAGTLDPAFAERAYQHVGRYGCDCHRQQAWVAAQDITDGRSRIGMMQALRRGVASAGASFAPSDLARLTRTVQGGLTAADDGVVLGSLQLAATIDYDVAPAALELVTNPKRSEAVRLAAFAAVEKQPKDKLLPACSDIVKDATSPPALREKALPILAASTKLLDLILLKDLLKTAPHRQGVLIATGLASSKEGTAHLFAAVQTGNASARLLQEKAVLDRLKATNADKWEARVKELTAGLPSADARIAALLKQRGDGFKKAKIDLDAGKKLFGTTCANCHQLGGQGAKVGPQLDGIGNRGVERIMEDVLDPNRNVDHAFYTTTLELKDGRQLSGLLRVEGKTLILIDPQAKETRVSEADVDKKRTSPLSPMPSDIAEKLKPQEFYHLIGYLADQRQK
ncbi:PVC-type heme-binding CxxCH protein [Limnoglobus roseus]|uniref:Putative beta-propeller-type glycoside hydrolase n=1 Tax=Limnoglobus roseus TaxID=2598579 RepID=A0A5C1AFJ0_9BACT|nr:PVC-type heme-binding CxxCH protein [Limnoglobus roseus]QEL15758.1 putative beta-propeller-type glycoside hydrolase [Limnoglobus roseus]